jgi:hypothetical protein
LSNVIFWVLKWNYHIFFTIFIVDKEGIKLFIKEGGAEGTGKEVGV